MTQSVSNAVNKIRSDPRQAVDASASGTKIQIYRDTVTVPDTANADVIILKPIPVEAVIEELEVTTADLGSAGTIDVGFYIYHPGDDTYVAVDKDCIADNLAVSDASSAAIAPQRFAGLAADDIDKKAWEIAGLTEKPAYSEFYIGLTTDTGTTVAGVVTVAALYTI